MTAEDDIRRCLKYEPDTGFIRWVQKLSSLSRAKIGERAGSIQPPRGYRRIALRRKTYYEHRLAWVLTHGCWPSEGFEIDHVNGDPADNRLANLRLATPTQNQHNAKSHRDSGCKYRGVVWDKNNGKWKAASKIDGKIRHLGHFDDPEDAARAYDEAAKEHFGEFAKLNFPKSQETNP